MSSRRDPDNQPILDVDILFWGFLLGVGPVVAVIVALSLGWPFWAALLLALPAGALLAPLRRLHERRLDARRPRPADD